MIFILILIQPFAIAVHCYAAVHNDAPLLNKSRLFILASSLVIALSIVPSGFVFTDAVLYWLRAWNLPFLLPFVLFLAGGIFLTNSTSRVRFLLAMACFAAGSAVSCGMYTGLLYAYSLRAAVILGILSALVLCVLFARLRFPRGLTGIVLLLCALCVSARCILSALEMLRWISLGKSPLKIALSAISSAEFLVFIASVLLLVAGFLHSRAFLLGGVSKRANVACALCFSLSQFITIFCYCAMAAASV